MKLDLASLGPTDPARLAAAALFAEYDAWRATQPTPPYTVPGYEHSLFIRWRAARLEGRSPR